MFWVYLPVDQLKHLHVKVSTPTSSQLHFADVWQPFGLGETRRIIGQPVTGSSVHIINIRGYAGNWYRTLTLCEVKVYGDPGEGLTGYMSFDHFNVKQLRNTDNICSLYCS